MEDQLILSDTAKSAKLKGFNIPTINYFREWYGEIQERHGAVKSRNILTTPTREGKVVEEFFDRPTQALLQRWLREEHDVHIFIIQPISKYFVEWKPIKETAITMFKFSGAFTKGFDTYEEALEQGLQEVLKLLNTINHG